MDTFDRAILELLQNDARLTSEAIGRQVGLATATVHRRIRRLRDSGVIQAEVAILDARRLGQSMTFIVSVEIERERPELLEAFKKAMRASPQVQQCYYVTGETDFVLVVKASDMDDYERFTHTAFFGNSNVRRYTTSVVMGEVKTGLSVPVS